VFLVSGWLRKTEASCLGGWAAINSDSTNKMSGTKPDLEESQNMQKNRSTAGDLFSAGAAERTVASDLKEVLTPEDLAEILGISVWTVYAKTSKRNRDQTNLDLPPFFRMGKLIRFWRRDLISWLKSRDKIDPNKREQP
jgi:predicted DNA-binding transcriptional regulator AlpA